MKPWKLVEYSLVLVLALLLGGLVVGQALGQPVLLSYVETGSMAPTLQPGDGFIAIPIGVAGPLERGDVVTFEAQTLHGGGLTTHRIVGETDDGYITRGDANPTTDQDGGEPPVQRAQIVAKAYQLGGDVVVIPNLGLVVLAVNGVLGTIQQQLASVFRTRAFLGTQGLAYLLFGVGVVAYLLSEFKGQGRDRTRTVSRGGNTLNSGLLVIGLAVLLVVFLTAAMTVPAGTQEFGFVSSTADAPGPGVIPTGQSESFRYRVPSNGLLPTVVFLEPGSPRLEVQPQELYVPSNSVRESIVEIHAPPETGYYRVYLTEHRYLALLPVGTIRTLYAIHPWLPIIVIDALIGGGFAGIGVSLIGGGRTRMRHRALPARERLRRWFR